MTEANFEGFRIIEELGAGALSTVYKAVQEPLGRTVALKVLKGTVSPSSPFAMQLEREARVLAELCHSNIGLLYDFVKTDTRMYLVLEHVDGFSLARVLEKVKKISPDAVAAIGAEVARGLAHAHERGVVHRDIKPANLLISKRGEVKIADFGIAQRERLPSADEPLTRGEESEAFGTPAYMSPEQILGEVVDARSDLFSLGVVLYQMLCGARPFEKGDGAERRTAAQRIRREPAIPLHTRAPDVPRELERIVMRMIEKLPVDRFSSAAVVAEQLEEFLASRTRVPRARLAARVLVRAGLITADSGANATASHAVRDTPMSLRGPLLGLVAIFALIVVGAFVLQGGAPRHEVQPGDRPLELVPSNPGALRVLATPWAHVTVDGQYVDTTPFARPIPLSSGEHHVLFTHPNAPPVRRAITIAPGETVTLEVTMSIGAEPQGALDGGAEAGATQEKKGATP